MFYVYILKSKVSNRHYIGQTKNVNQRLLFHNSPKARATKKYQPWELIHVEEFQTRAEAVKKELKIKSIKDAKRYLSSI
jgi:putative endonuclease